MERETSIRTSALNKENVVLRYDSVPKETRHPITIEYITR